LLLPTCRQFGRDLQRWMPEEGDAADSALLSLEDSASGWDQFSVNEKRFGVTTTYNEAIYTTVLDKDRCGISEAEAARIAREIERGVASAPMGSGLAAMHMLEERGMEIDDQVGVCRAATRAVRWIGACGLSYG
jgi:PAB1-binding protein PBP1